jgi:hypothetical protein
MSVYFYNDLPSAVLEVAFESGCIKSQDVVLKFTIMHAFFPIGKKKVKLYLQSWYLCSRDL